MTPAERARLVALADELSGLAETWFADATARAPEGAKISRLLAQAYGGTAHKLRAALAEFPAETDGAK